jgi:uncharacterized Fe-S cluster protein YjdI
MIKHYTNGDVTIIWEPERCMHSAICFRGLPSVFKPKERPWVRPEGTSTEQIIAQIEACPSGALRYERKAPAPPPAPETGTETRVEALPNGPLLVYGTLRITDRQGEHRTETRSTAFCRCGASANKPYCDGSHRRAGFEG